MSMRTTQFESSGYSQPVLLDLDSSDAEINCVGPSGRYDAAPFVWFFQISVLPMTLLELSVADLLLVLEWLGLGVVFGAVPICSAIKSREVFSKIRRMPRPPERPQLPPYSAQIIDMARLRRK